MDKEQQKALLYYEGDVQGSDPFWGDKKAYTTLNSLLFPGFANEKARSLEGKKLNPEALRDISRLLSLYKNLLAAFRVNPATEPVITWRVERFSDYRKLKEAGRTISFTSTSTAGFLSAYQDKKGLALMEFRIPAGVPRLNLAKALPEYKKADEAEILLPPWLGLTFEEQPLNRKEESILDADGKPPAVKAVVTPRLPWPVKPGEDDAASGWLKLEDGEGTQAGMRLYEALNKGLPASEADVACFTAWKNALQERLRAVVK